jgi:hypothetical protein
MTAIEAAKKVSVESTCHLVRPRKGEPTQYDAKPAFTGSKRGWFYLDAYTASAISKVHAALNESNRAKFEALPITRMASVAFRLCA